MRILLLIIIASLGLPPAVPPETRGLAAGYHMTPHGCITNSDHDYPLINPEDERKALEAEATRLSPDDPRTKQAYGFAQFPSAYYSYSARYFAARARYDEAFSAYRRAIEEEAKENLTQGSKNFTRLAYSILLYRQHHIAQAKAQWRILTAIGRKYAGLPDAATQAAVARHFHQSLVELAMSPPNFNPMFKEDGAAYNLQRGLNAAASNDPAGARRFLNYSLECNWMFPIPHLGLGLLDAAGGDFTSARHEWLADLEGGEPDPPDTADIMGAQFDAIYLLLAFD